MTVTQELMQVVEYEGEGEVNASPAVAQGVAGS